jgi:hypothetical protein
VINEAAMRSWGPGRTCPAAAIRDILRGRLVPDPDPHGLRLRGARISGPLDLENLTTDIRLELRDCLLDEGILAAGARLPYLGLAGCRIGHCAAPAADVTPADAQRLARAGAVDLPSAHIAGQLDCTGAQLSNGTGPALDARRLQVDQNMPLRGKFTGSGRGKEADGSDAVVLNLRSARINGKFQLDPAGLIHEADPSHQTAADPHRRLDADGLTYADVPRMTSDPDWLRLLREGTPRYATQPYQQLAAGYRALGDEQRARETLMKQRDDQLARSGPSPWDLVWGRVTKVTLGYGYQPWRALLFLAAVLVLSCLLAVTLGSHGALAQAAGTAHAGQSCTVMQQVSVGLDLNLPVGTTLARAGCGLPANPASTTATWLTATGWLLRVLAWAFAALFIAGFTSAVRKT